MVRDMRKECQVRGSAGADGKVPTRHESAANTLGRVPKSLGPENASFFACVLSFFSLRKETERVQIGSFSLF